MASWKFADRRSDLLVLNSVHNLHRAEDFIRTHETLHCFLDNDEAGKHAFEKLAKFCPEVIDQSPFYRNFKDLNDYLTHQTKPSTPTHKKSLKF